MGGRRVPRKVRAADRRARGPLRSVPGDGADATQLATAAVVLARRRAAAPAARRRGGALLLAFTILAAAALRRDVTDARRRLTWFGARRWQVELFTFAESTVGRGRGDRRRLGARRSRRRADRVARRLARRRRRRARAALERRARAPRRRSRSPPALLLYPTVRAPALQLGRLALTPLDVAALGAIGVVLVGWARGSVDAQQLAGGGGTNAFLLLVPALIVFAAAVVVRPPARAGAARARPRRPPRAGLAAARRRSRSRATRGTRRSRRRSSSRASASRSSPSPIARRSPRASSDEAAFAVPAPYVLTEDLSQLVPVLHGGQHLRPAGDAGPAALGQRPVRDDVRVPRLPRQRDRDVGGWRSDFAPDARRSSPRRRAGARRRSRRRSRRAGSSRCRRRRTGDDIDVRAFFRSPLGDYDAVGLGHTRAGHPSCCTGASRSGTRRSRSSSFDILNSGRLAANAGTGIQPSAKGTVSFGTLRVDGKAVPLPRLDRPRRRQRRPGQARLHPHDRRRRRLSPACSRPTACRCRCSRPRRRRGRRAATA